MIITTAAACGKSQSPTNGSSQNSGEDAIVTTADNDPAAQEDMDKLNELYAEAESVVSDIKAALDGNDSFKDYLAALEEQMTSWKSNIEKAISRGTKYIVQKELDFAEKQLESLKADLEKLAG